MAQSLLFNQGYEHTEADSCINVDEKKEGGNEEGLAKERRGRAMPSEMTQSLDHGSEHTTDSYFNVDEKKQDSEGLVKGRGRGGLSRSRSMIIALQSPSGNKSRRGNLTFSNSVRQLARAGTSRRHLVTEENEEASSNCVRQLSRAGTSLRNLVTDESSDDSAEEASQ
jgi:hypothetical protein